MRYEEALAKFHCRLPAKDPIPIECVGNPHAANAVWLENGGIEEEWTALKDAKDGNYYRAFVETMNFLGFLWIGERQEDETFEDFSAWRWRDTTDHLEEDDLCAIWEVLMQDLENKVERNAEAAKAEEEAKQRKAEPL